MLGRGGTRHSCRASSRRFTYSCEPLHRVNEKCGQSAGARPYCIPGDRVHRAPLVTVAPQGKRNVHERRARARWRIKCSFYRGEFQRDALKSKIHRFSVFFLSVFFPLFFPFFSLSFFLFFFFFFPFKKGSARVHSADYYHELFIRRRFPLFIELNGNENIVRYKL